MGYYNVVAPCVIGKLHYAQPTTQPIELDDDVAAPLVTAGALERYGQLPEAAPPESVEQWTDPLTYENVSKRSQEREHEDDDG